MTNARLSLRVVCTGLILVAVGAASFAHAQAGSTYYYKNIEQKIEVNRDASISVEEWQTFHFSGEYHRAFRVLSHEGLDSVSDIEVINWDSGERLKYSSKKLDPMDSKSWEKYTTYTENDATYIEWYYDLGDNEGKDTERTWILRYKAHGAVSFLEDHDELNWSLFTSYSVPVQFVEASVHLPELITATSSAFYRSVTDEYIADMPDESTYHFFTQYARPDEDMRIVVGWQKGVVSEEAYLRDRTTPQWPYYALALVVLFFVYKRFFSKTPSSS